MLRSLFLTLRTPLPNSVARLSQSHAAVGLGKQLFPLFALALDLPETFFDNKASGATLSVIYLTILVHIRDTNPHHLSVIEY